MPAYDDFKGTSRRIPDLFNAYKDMIVPSQPGWAEEHIRRLTAAGIQSAFQCYNINSFESVERMMRRGIYKGPLVMNWVAISGGMDAPNIYNLANFLRAAPDGAVITVESSVLNVLPVNMIGIAMGLHVRCGIEDVLWNQTRTGKIEHGRADRAAGAHLARIRPPHRDRAAGARDHARSASSTTRRKSRCWPTASRPIATAATRASCARPHTLSHRPLPHKNNRRDKP